MSFKLETDNSSRTTIAEKVAFLRQASAYDGVACVDVKESHLAWIFLTETLAYKLKKPVRYGQIDFRTLEARREDCEAEVRLNRRLAPDVYLETTPLVRTSDGTLALDVAGEPVDWLVKMIRMPERWTLEHCILSGDPPAARLGSAAQLLAEFYQRADRTPMTSDRYLARFRKDIEENRDELTDPQSELSTGRIGALAAAQSRFIARQARSLGARGFQVVEAHGDLRPEHLYLVKPPVVLDCLEFNRDLRLLDPADELAFLAMECERLGNRAAGEVFLDVYEKMTGDVPSSRIIAFYGAYRATLRAKLAIWHLRDPEITAIDKWRKRTAEYLGLAESYVSAFE